MEDSILGFLCRTSGIQRWNALYSGMARRCNLLPRYGYYIFYVLARSKEVI